MPQEQYDEQSNVPDSFATFVLDAFDAASYELDLGSGTLRPSPRLNALLGFPADPPLTAADADARLRPDDRGAMERAVAAAVANGTNRFHHEYQVRLPNGALRWLLSHGEIVPDTDGRPAIVRGALVDISERRQAEQAWRASEARQSFLLELADALRSSPDAAAIQATVTRAARQFFNADR